MDTNAQRARRERFRALTRETAARECVRISWTDNWADVATGGRGTVWSRRRPIRISRHAEPERQYWILMHEIGHLDGNEGAGHATEHQAWEWAFENGVEISDEAWEFAEWCLSTYGLAPSMRMETLAAHRHDPVKRYMEPLPRHNVKITWSNAFGFNPPEGI